MISVSSKIVDELTKSTYSSYKFKIGKTLWCVTTVKGKFNYVTVKKLSSNPWLTLGTEFDTMNSAVSHYKNPTMKMNLRLIEMGML